MSDLMQGCRVAALGPDRANPDFHFASAWLPVVDLDPVDRAEQPDMLPHLCNGDLTHFRLRRLRFFFAKGIEAFQNAHNLNRRPHAAARSWDAGIIQAICNGPQTRFPGRL